MEASRPLAPRRAPLRFDDCNARARLFGAWTASILEKVHGAFAEVEEKEGRIVAVLGAHEDLDVQARCQSDGVLSLQSLAISGFRITFPAFGTTPSVAKRRRSNKDGDEGAA